MANFIFYHQLSNVMSTKFKITLELSLNLSEYLLKKDQINHNCIFRN